MGGRGSYSGGSSKEYENIALGSPTARIPYSQYKNEYGGATSVKDSYNKTSKTIEVKVGAATRDIMKTIPDDVVKEFPRNMSKYQIAVNINNQFRDMIYSGEKLFSGASKWQRRVYGIVKAEADAIKQYGSVEAARRRRRK